MHFDMIVCKADFKLITANNCLFTRYILHDMVVRFYIPLSRIAVKLSFFLAISEDV